ncbi:MAG TPA: L-seryl-tRNA(Sec) selenium transferase [Acidobacteriota bacterium]|nr:L-seryl-tRNA(Sec) selenium transferase [Acidobacteriota bacterium]
MSKLRDIPPVSQVIDRVLNESWSKSYSRNLILRATREELSAIRKKRQKDVESSDDSDLLKSIRLRLENFSSYSLKPVINATGIIVHTNLGRAPLAEEAIEHLTKIARVYNNLEFDVESGRRGSREKHLEKFLGSIIPAEASLVVNNNAAALLLILNTFADEKEVIVSRGELVEIGGSFRLPDILKRSGAILREIGTTNKTRLSDYRNAVNEKTGLILSVHPSNFQIIGFTEKPQFSELADLAKELKIPLIEDHGSGILVDLEKAGIQNEPSLALKLEEGADLICFSGDKIFGGPQCGIVAGKKDLIEKMRANPLFRALRVDKMIYAALEATAALYLNDQASRIPVIRMLFTEASELQRRAEDWCNALNSKFPDAHFTVEPTICYVGGGVAPMKGVPSSAVAVEIPGMKPAELGRLLRLAETPVIARIDADRVFLELRTITEDEQKQITNALEKIKISS